MGGNSIISRSAKHGTPRNRKYLCLNAKRLLVAQHEEGHRRIRQRMCVMPSKQDQHTPAKTTPSPNNNQHRSRTVRSDRHGLHRQTTQVPGIRYHSNHHGPRLQQSRHLYPLQRNNHRRRSGRTDNQTRIPSLWIPTKNYLGPRHPIHVPIHETLLSENRNETKRVHGLSPTNGRTIRTIQSVARTISATHMQSTTRQLGRSAPFSSIRTQRMAKCHNKRNPVLTNHGMDTKSHMDKSTIRSTISRQEDGGITN